jgi:hypothetical protein
LIFLCREQISATGRFNGPAEIRSLDQEETPEREMIEKIRQHDRVWSINLIRQFPAPNKKAPIALSAIGAVESSSNST